MQLYAFTQLEQSAFGDLVIVSWSAPAWGRSATPVRNLDG